MLWVSSDLETTIYQLAYITIVILNSLFLLVDLRISISQILIDEFCQTWQCGCGYY